MKTGHTGGFFWTRVICWATLSWLALTNYRPHLIGGFSDEMVNNLLYLDPEQEGAIAVFP
jgi:hypothetical protein